MLNKRRSVAEAVEVVWVAGGMLLSPQSWLHQEELDVGTYTLLHCMQARRWCGCLLRAAVAAGLARPGAHFRLTPRSKP